MNLICKRFLAAAMLLLFMCSGAFAQAVLFPQEEQPGTACVSVEEGVYSLSNDLFAAKFILADGTLKFNGCEELGLLAGTEIFKVQLADGTEIPASQFTLSGDVAMETLAGDPDAVKGARRFAGKQLVANFAYTNGLEIQWRAVLRDGSHYLRTEVDIMNGGTEGIEMYSITPMMYTVENVEGEKAPAVVGNTRGAVIASDKIFAGLETPMGIQTAGEATDLESFVFKAWDGATSWAWEPADNDIPAGIKALSQYAQGTVFASRGYLAFRQSGDQVITFDYTSGNNRLQILGIDILDVSGNVVDSDYHFGYTGGSDSNRDYTVTIDEVGAYMIRFFVSNNGSGEGFGSVGTITYSKKVTQPSLVYDLASTETPYITPAVIEVEDEDVTVETTPETEETTEVSLTWADNLPNFSAEENAPDGLDAWESTESTMVVYSRKLEYAMGAGELSVKFQHTSGYYALDVLGIDILDADGTVVASDYHYGAAGTQTYTLTIPSSATYTLRILVDKQGKESSYGTNGNITITHPVYTEPVATVGSLNAENASLSDTWVSAWTGFSNWEGALPSSTTLTGTAKYKDTDFYNIDWGRLDVLFDYTSGNHGLYVLGVQVIDADDRVVAQQFKNGFTGSSSTVTYTVCVPQTGAYKLRYITDYRSGGTDTNGDITISYTTVAHITGSQQQTKDWTSAWEGFAVWTDAPEDLKAYDNSTKTETTPASVQYIDQLYKINAGSFSVLYDYTSGGHGLHPMGVVLYNVNGEIVSTDYHAGFTGGSDVNNTYTVRVPETGFYTVKFVVDKNSGGTDTNGTITLSVVEMVSLGSIAEDETISQTWAPASWVTIAAEKVPNRVNEVGCNDENARIMEQIITIKSAGQLSVNFDYTSGNNKLVLVGVDLVDETGNVACDDYHAGETGNSDVDNTYKINVFAPGTYTMRYFVNNATEALTSSGNITITLKVDYTLHLIAPETTPITGMWRRQTTLDAEEEWSVGAVVGLIAPGQARRSFLAYSERERAVPWRAVPVYISWYEINIDRNNAAPGEEHINTDETKCLPIVAEWKEQLYDAHGEAPYAFVWDDGWDTYGEWQFHSGFPNGFTRMDSIGREMGAGQGAWLGPVGGYGTSGGYRRAYWTSTKTGGMQLSNPLYYEVFVNAVTNLLHGYGYDFRFFKFDGISSQFSSVGPDAGATGEENAEAIIMAEQVLRSIKEDVFLNTTVGTWASPFWFQFTDAVWRQEKDDDRIGNNSNTREQWITYRDRLVYQNYVQNSPLCPINTLMTHGFIFTEYGNPASFDRSWKNVVNELRCAFACGSGMVELYNDYKLTNELVNPATGNAGELWGEIAACMKWQRKNSDVLPDIHWVGGNPWTGAKSEIYGWAAWNAQKAVMTLRNGANDAQSITLTLREALDIPAYVKTGTTITLSHAFADQASIEGFSGLEVGTPIDIDTELTITLPGSSVFVFDGTDDSFSGVETGKFYRFKDTAGNYITSNAAGETLAVSATADASSIFWLNDENELLSFSNGLYLNTFEGGNGGFEAVGHEGNEVTFTKGAVDGSIKIAVADGRYLQSNGTAVTTTSSGYYWFAEEVTALPVTVSSVGYSTINAPVALEVPEGATAYTAQLDGDCVNLNEVSNGVIPASTPVVVKAAADTYEFAVTADVDAVSDNAFLGTLETIAATEVEAPYTLQTKRDDSNNVVGVIMRKYIGENITGFKMYMNIPDSEAAALSFRFPGTTGIIEVVTPSKQVGKVYDLFGRPVENPTKGVYIVDDKKVVF